MIKLGRKKRAKDRTVRFYLYLSDSKVNTLYDQMPKPLRKSIAGELKVQAPFVGASVHTVAASPETQMDKLAVVERWLELSERLGDLRDDRLYFRFSMPMSWGYLKAPPGKDGESVPRVVFFSATRELELEDGSSERQFLALGGSAQHIIGASTEGFVTPGSMLPQLAVELGNHYYLDPDAQRWVASEAEIAPLPTAEGHAAQPDWTKHLLELAKSVHFKVPKQNVSGIAVRLVSDYEDYRHPSVRVIPDGYRQVFGSPLYVALEGK
jgi:hypothetical protein